VEAALAALWAKAGLTLASRTVGAKAPELARCSVTASASLREAGSSGEAGSTTTARLLVEAASFRSLPHSRLKSLVRVGVPPHIRPALWLAASGGLQLRAEHESTAAGIPSATVRYEQLAAAAADLPPLTYSQVQSDASGVALTWRTHPHIASVEGQAAVARVLTALLAHNPSVGYGRPLAHMAAFMLVVFGGEKQQEAVFWTLAALLQTRLYGYIHGQVRRGTWMMRPSVILN
jgi:hypothetical protein